MDIKAFIINKLKLKILFNLKYCLCKGFPLRLILCDIYFECVPKSTHFGHPYGITIGRSIIGENCNIRQNITIGKSKKSDLKYPVRIGNNVDIGAHSIIIGELEIGDNAVIGAGSIILKSVPKDKTVVGLWK